MVRYLFYTIGDLTYQSPLVYGMNKLSLDMITEEELTATTQVAVTKMLLLCHR